MESAPSDTQQLHGVLPTICRKRIATLKIVPIAVKTHNVAAFNLGQIISNYEQIHTRVGTLKVATIYLQLIQNRYMFRSFTVLQCRHQNCVQPVASDVEVVGYL